MLAFLKANWGNIASVIGAVLTVFASFASMRASKMAQQASEGTRARLGSIDLLNEVQRLIGRVDELSHHLSQSTWPMVFERATDLRLSTSVVVLTGAKVFTDDISNKLSEAVVQFSEIADLTDKHVQNGNKAPDIARCRRIASNQKETLFLALQELKQKLGELE